MQAANVSNENERNWKKSKSLDLISFSHCCITSCPFCPYWCCNGCRFVAISFYHVSHDKFSKSSLNPDAVNFTSMEEKKNQYSIRSCCRQLHMRLIIIIDINYKIRSAKCNGTTSELCRCWPMFILARYINYCIDNGYNCNCVHTNEEKYGQNHNKAESKWYFVFLIETCSNKLAIQPTNRQQKKWQHISRWVCWNNGNACFWFFHTI